MSRTITSAMVSGFERDYLARFSACRASLRNLILLSEKVDPEYNRSTFKRLKDHFEAVDSAFKVMEVAKPNKPTTQDEKYIQLWSSKDSEVPDEYGEK